MEVRLADLSDKTAIVSMYELSQRATGLPDPTVTPPELLGAILYVRPAIERYVAEEGDLIVGHGLIEPGNPQHLPKWLGGNNEAIPVLELGGAFVHPDFAKRGIWSALLIRRMQRVRELGALPVSATWIQNSHVINRFEKMGGRYVGNNIVPGGEVALYVFDYDEYIKICFLSCNSVSIDITMDLQA